MNVDLHTYLQDHKALSVLGGIIAVFIFLGGVGVGSQIDTYSTECIAETPDGECAIEMTRHPTMLHHYNYQCIPSPQDEVDDMFCVVNNKHAPGEFLTVFDYNGSLGQVGKFNETGDFLTRIGDVNWTKKQKGYAKMKRMARRQEAN